MRKLYVVPIVHQKADMGSMAPALEKLVAEEIGQAEWRKHEEEVERFWDSIDAFFSSLDASGLKIYQDGLIADGAAGLKIISEGVKLGSKNYLIIGKLLGRGAKLVKTEDPFLVKGEYDYIAKIARAKSERERETWASRYRLARDRLLHQRDDFIAKRIAETLGEGETGVLFIGASHRVQERLLEDILVITVKDDARVSEYRGTPGKKEKGRS
ncbi:MAG: hypothetical protein HYX85_02755 [Chloroflexi bacterium]|nr:hypothetical protein [Chloroflexota bacterium]